MGFQGCLGYDYHPEDKSLTVNEEEANIVRYIFQRYIEGTGCTILSNELKNLGYKTKRDSPPGLHPRSSTLSRTKNTRGPSAWEDFHRGPDLQTSAGKLRRGR